MNWRILSVAMCCFFGMWPVTSYSQDDETKTQALLDQHKEADPTNSARSLTSKPRLSERVTSEVPLPRGPSPETEKLIAKLEKQKEAFVTRRVKAESQKRAG